MRFRSLIALLLAATLVRAAAPPADFEETYGKLSAFLDQAELSPLDVAAGSFWGARFYAVGEPGLAANRGWFRSALTRGGASAAGLYLVAHGSGDDLLGVRRELETSRSKRGWLQEMVGTEKQFHASLMAGKMWAPLSRVLPSTDGCRTLAVLCLRSRDPLVRRAGAFWGYWFADEAYWANIRRLAAGDADAVTKKVAAGLLQRAPRSDIKPNKKSA